jgi:hypothetical protein
MWEKKPYVITIKPVENSLASILVTRISKEVRDETSWNKILCARKIVEKVVIYTFTQEYHEFQRRKGKTNSSAASAILFVWVTNGVILPLDSINSTLTFNYFPPLLRYKQNQNFFYHEKNYFWTFSYIILFTLQTRCIILQWCAREEIEWMAFCSLNIYNLLFKFYDMLKTITVLFNMMIARVEFVPNKHKLFDKLQHAFYVFLLHGCSICAIKALAKCDLMNHKVWMIIR